MSVQSVYVHKERNKDIKSNKYKVYILIFLISIPKSHDMLFLFPMHYRAVSRCTFLKEAAHRWLIFPSEFLAHA